MSDVARQKVLEASALVEAIRPSADAVIGGEDPKDDPIRQAWDAAREAFRKACAAYLEAVKGQ